MRESVRYDHLDLNPHLVQSCKKETPLLIASSLPTRACAMAALVTSLFCGSLFAQATLPIMPLPARATAATGSFAVGGPLRVVFTGYQEPRLDRARQRFLANVERRTGIPQWNQSLAAPAAITIHTAGPSATVQKVADDESYKLQVSPGGITVAAPTPLGAMHALQTILQLIELTPSGFDIPAVTIDDAPRFPWRGLMVDSGRHFISLDVLYRTLDGMEATKLNVFHWHLSENQGFRIESKTYPLLTEKGSDGLYYTQDQAKEVIAYARDRGIRVIPEFDMPGHATAWFVGYPDLASGPGPYQIDRQWGIFDPAMDPTRESTYKFLDKFFAEMTALFPDAYFHIGGDECNGKEWDRNPRIQEYMRAHNLKDDAALQAYFTTRVQELVTKHGKIPIGWDEVLQPNTPKQVMIQSWRGQESVADAAKNGHNVILSNGYYIDLSEPASQHYAVDPLGKAADLTPEEKSHILGGEATIWSEMVTSETIESRIWPRTAAIAERLWSPQDVTDQASMYKRLAIAARTLTWQGIPYLATSSNMIERIANGNDSHPMRVLASVVEPPKEYARPDLKPYDSSSPMNLLVDAVSPESDTAREFRELTTRIANGTATPADHTQARQWLTLWRDNDAALQPTISSSALAAELAPISRNLHDSSAIGLAALDAIEQKQPLAAADQSQKLTALKALEAPQAVLLNMTVPGVETLVTAASR
jgi:hexosaminidase